MLLSRTLLVKICICFYISILSVTLFASDLTLIETQFPIENIRLDEIARANTIINKYKNPSNQNQSCPLQSNNYKKILSKIETIRNLFKDNCMDIDQARLDAILEGARIIQADLDAAGVQADNNQTINDILNGDIPVSSNTNISGQQIANVFNNINSIFINGKCKLDRGSFLEQTADVIQSFAAMGMMVPNANGLFIAGGGMALSSILKAIDAIFSDRFNFSNMKDRQTFIKLNCAFYDLRQDIQNSGIVDVSTEEHHRFKVEATSLINSVEMKIKEIAKNKDQIEKNIANTKAIDVKQKMERLLELDKVILKGLAAVRIPLVDTDHTSANTLKLRTINILTKISFDLKEKLKKYFASDLNSIPVLDELLLEELRKLDFKGHAADYRALLKQDVRVFNSGFLANLHFHFYRINEDIATSKSKVEADFIKKITIKGLSLDKYLASLEKKTKEIITDLLKLKKSLTITLKKLNNITSDRGFTSGDDGSENVVNIFNQYNDIASQVYGKWGYKFLEYTTGESENRNKDFNKKFIKFAGNHLNLVTNVEGIKSFSVRSSSDLSELRIMYACQDAMPFRRTFIHADSLIQQGYDFIETNKRLFHSDVPRGFLGKKSQFRHIQMHHKSSIFANKILKGETVSQDLIDKYINKTYSISRKKYLGKIMLDVSSSRKNAALLQRVIDQYDCQSITLDEKNN
jgi:hypothetical protein